MIIIFDIGIGIYVNSQTNITIVLAVWTKYLCEFKLWNHKNILVPTSENKYNLILCNIINAYSSL